MRKKVAKVELKLPKKQIKTPESNDKVVEDITQGEVDLNKLAIAVSMAETSWFTKWYWLTHFNGQGIKNGNTVPCPWVPKMKMCKFSSQEESHKAFITIWSKWYGWFPTLAMAEKWTGSDNAEDWLRIVKFYYYS